MEEKTFYRLLLAVVIFGMIATLCHLVYCIYAYQHCSIIWFIGKELW